MSRCRECRHYEEHGHSFECSIGQASRTLEEWKKFALSWWGMAQRTTLVVNRLRREIVFWQGKFHAVRTENNALRRRLRPTTPSSDPTQRTGDEK